MQKLEMVKLKENLEKGDVLIIVSPVVWTAAPLGGIHLLQASCRQIGITTSILYSNLLYSNLIGADLHTALAMEDYFLLEERLFAASAFNLPPMGRRLHKYFESGWVPDHIWPKNKKFPEVLIPEVISPFKEQFSTINWEHLETLTRDWCKSLAQQITEMEYRIVGCSTTHGGLAPAIALLRRIKEIDPNIITVLGGSLCEGEMAQGILSLKSNIDYIFSGEGDLTFPILTNKTLAGELPEEKIIYGEICTNLDKILLPDYAEYFHQKKHFLPTNASYENIHIPYETSRGCWFGKCTFCGLTGKTNIYRQKSPTHIINELKQLIQRYDVTNVFMTDNILPPMYFKTLFPQIAVEIPSLRLLYEIKANLTLDQLHILQEAGAILIQPGIESLSPSLLRRMNKEVTVHENIALLRYARSLNLEIKWNLLFGFPGDQAAEYEGMLDLLSLIHHLQPPDRMISVRICRFSRYQKSPEDFNLANLRPAEVHKDVFPDHADLEKLSYFFAVEYDSDSFENPILICTLYEEYKAWRRRWISYSFLPLNPLLPELHLSRISPDEFVLRDSRCIPGNPEISMLDREQAGQILVARPWRNSRELQWALDAKLGVVLDSWFIPLATAEPALLREFEHGYDQNI
jgi:ribosomal peptide maturation radical SAM protein 1